MDRIAKIENGIVTNVIAVSRETSYATAQYLKKNGKTISIDKKAEIGDEFDGVKIKKKKKDKKDKLK